MGELQANGGRRGRFWGFRVLGPPEGSSQRTGVAAAAVTAAAVRVTHVVAAAAAAAASTTAAPRPPYEAKFISQDQSAKTPPLCKQKYGDT